MKMMRKAVQGHRIFIAYDHPLFRDALNRLLDHEPAFQVVGQGGATELQAVCNLRPDVLLLDLSTPRRGLETLHALRTMSSGVRSLALASEPQRDAQIAAMHLGAHGIVLEEGPTAYLISGIREVAAGRYWLNGEAALDADEVVRRLSRDARTVIDAPDRCCLTRREREILSAVVEGESDQGIADRLSISPITVKHHLSHVFDKLGVASRLELTLFAVNHQLVASGNVAADLPWALSPGTRDDVPQFDENSARRSLLWQLSCPPGGEVSGR